VPFSTVVRVGTLWSHAAQPPIAEVICTSFRLGSVDFAKRRLARLKFSVLGPASQVTEDGLGFRACMVSESDQHHWQTSPELASYNKADKMPSFSEFQRACRALCAIPSRTTSLLVFSLLNLRSYHHILPVEHGILTIKQRAGSRARFRSS
jgi:hypothetical protein